MSEPFYKFIEQLLPQFKIDSMLIEPQLELKQVHKGEFLFYEGEVCKSIGFILKGCIRTLFLKEGKEFTLFFNTENQLVGDYESYRKRIATSFAYQAIEDSNVLLLSDQALHILFEKSPDGQRLARLIAETYLFRLREKLLSLYVDTPEERYLKLSKIEPELMQRIPQYYLAAYLGIEPESLSRLKRRIYRRQTS